eukprot:CAMPEP_0113844612 /NCGR_PEP_ID=MMETSP0372-20130328/325_1 /TAXON_ID=340204 /ORGANISM="Lankesteria abbotti" /LENGTH=356 /DNA_ID=CAMNT_0000813617 /DNA_START=142 /DNA_END=1209 /DNA_ORIENTATION=- /assembly_acc=CAM_ASM_000359
MAPLMGFNTWNAQGCSLSMLNEATVRRTARFLKDAGLVASGYEYFVVDDCWSEHHRDASNDRLVADADRFAGGMKQLGEDLNSLGMKFGMYGDAGTHTCEKYPGSRGYELVDAEAFVEWGAEYLKYDGCFLNLNDMEVAYTDMSRALSKHQRGDRHVSFSCSWPAYVVSNTPGGVASFDWKKIGDICDTWRLYYDIRPSWSLIENIMDYWGTWQHVLAPSAAKGGFNDPDFLQVGHPDLTPSEWRSQMAVWSIIAAPLIISVDVLVGTDPAFKTERWIGDTVLDILSNSEIIEMNQELPPRQGLRISHSSRRDIWARPMNDGSLSLVIVNRLAEPQDITLSWGKLEMKLKQVGIVW